MNIAAKHGWPGTAAILISVGLHGTVYALLSTIEGPTPVVLPSEPVMAYIVPPPRFIPEPPPAPVEPELPIEPIEAPPPEPEPPPPVEPEPQPETRAEPTSETQTGPESALESEETSTDESEGRPQLTRFEWYAEIPEAIARMREAQEQAPQYREFLDLDALTAGAKTATDWALDREAEDVDAVRGETAAWGEERVWLNDNCYAYRPAPGSVLAEVHRFNNPMMNCEGSRSAQPRDDLFIEAMPEYLEDSDFVEDD